MSADLYANAIVGAKGGKMHTGDIRSKASEARHPKQGPPGVVRHVSSGPVVETPPRLSARGSGSSSDLLGAPNSQRAPHDPRGDAARRQILGAPPRRDHMQKQQSLMSLEL